MSNRRVAKSRPIPNRPSARTRPNRTPWIIGVIIVCVVAALVIAVLATTRSNGTASASGLPVVATGPVAFGDVQVKGTALPVLSSTPGATDPAVGMIAPTVTGETFTGSPLTIPATGKPSIIMFVAHWCPHCNKEVPEIVSDLDANGLPNGVDLFAVATGTNAQQANYPPGDWLHSLNWPVPTIADDQSDTAATAFGVSGYPTFVVLDAQGKVLARTSGELPIEQFHQLIGQAQGAGSTGTTAAPTAPTAPAVPAGSTPAP
jgi:cytochrome c biogenesis protein CcmG/thiol:disulfide interchange protein DsbE